MNDIIVYNKNILIDLVNEIKFLKLNIYFSFVFKSIIR